MIKGQKGFTLVEMMMVVALSAIVILGVFTALLVGSEQTQLSQVKMTLEESMRNAMLKMAQEIHQSAPDRITIAGNNLSIQFLVPDPASLVDGNYDVNWASAHSISYALGGTNNRQLIRTDLTTNQASVLANDITSIQFTGDAAQPNVVTITLNAQRALISGRLIPATPLQLTSQVEVRNP